MTRKDYVTIAKALGRGIAGVKNLHNGGDGDTAYLISCFTVALQKENSRFDEYKFREAILSSYKQTREVVVRNGATSDVRV
jgi:hypothetical protein